MDTYSVLILNEKNLEAFSRYRSLFSEILQSEEVGVCRWNEHGTSVDTALPELHALTDDKESWRAVIVRYFDDTSMTDFPSDPANPYDFVANADVNRPIRESEIPIVRLTQLLGGIPEPEKQFVAKTIREEHMQPRTVYVPVEDEERERDYRALEKKYRFDGRAPSSILILTVRRRADVPDDIGRNWLYFKESDSSEFWKRNRYPSNCRFMVCDYDSDGPLQREADDFNFWCSVMLLAINRIDAASLQAYRLYRVRTVMNRERMSEVFQKTANRLRDASYTIEWQIRRDLEEEICEEEPLPDYRLNIPVVLKSRKEEDTEFDPNEYGLLSEGERSELHTWSLYCEETAEKWARAVRSADRTLDQVADRMRERCRYHEDEVEPLNRYQEEDLDREVSQLYKKIVAVQKALPTESIDQSNRFVSEADENVRKQIIRHLMPGPVLTAVGIFVLLIVLACVPEFIRISQGYSDDVIVLVPAVTVQIAVVILTVFAVLFFRKGQLNDAIGAYNEGIAGAFRSLAGNATLYSRYMSDIASHTRGSSYLNHSDKKKAERVDAHQERYRHLKAINVLLSRLKTWSSAYHLDVDFSGKRRATRIEVDTTTIPMNNKMYSFETGERYPVRLNETRSRLVSTLSFVEGFEVIREELYDDSARDRI